MARRIREEATDDWDNTVAVEQFTGKGGSGCRPWSRHRDRQHTCVVQQDQVRRVTQTGARHRDPRRRPFPRVDGLAGTPYWTNHEALETKEDTASLTVVGSGYAAVVKMAQAFARFGTRSRSSRATTGCCRAKSRKSGELIGEVFRGKTCAS